MLETLDERLERERSQDVSLSLPEAASRAVACLLQGTSLSQVSPSPGGIDPPFSLQTRGGDSFCCWYNLRTASQSVFGISPLSSPE